MIDFTTASEREIRRVYDAIAREVQDDRLFTRKELSILPRILAANEQVLSFSSGLMDGNTWLIVLTDQRVLFVDKGLIYGVSQTSIELENIVSINGETGFLFGNIRITTAFQTHEIRNVYKRTVNPFLNSVRKAMTAHREGVKLYSPGTSEEINVEEAQNEMPAQPSDNITQKLERLERLRKSGSITNQQYEDEKARIS